MKRVLIADDDARTRRVLQILAHKMGLACVATAGADEALASFRAERSDLVITDLRMPAKDGIQFLRELRDIDAEVPAIVLTAHGSIPSAVEAMKLGAVDFIQKPFAAAEIRELVAKVIDRDRLDEKKAADYATYIELSKRSIGQRLFDAAVEHVRKAVSLDPARPEAFNLLGVLMEIRHHRPEAQEQYRAALALDPTYEPARLNLRRLTHGKWGEGLALDSEAKPKRGKAS